MSASAESDPARSVVKMEVDAPSGEAPNGGTPAAAEAVSAGDPGASVSGGGGEKFAGTGHKAALMKEGDTVILEHKISNHANEIRFIVLKPNEKVKIAKGNIHHRTVIGHSFGSKFEVTKVKGDVNVNVVEEDETDRAGNMNEEFAGEAGEEDAGVEQSKDNRGLVDWNQITRGQQTSQKLSDKDIAELRAKGADGKSLIKSLVENSETFKDKTEFSQEKWVKRKASKHLPSFIAHRASSLSLCRGYFMKEPAKTCHIREDSLARLLTLSNVQPGSRALVCDSMNGLLLASVVERMGGMGLAVNVFNTPQPSVDAVRWMNFDKEHLQTIINAPLHELSCTGEDLNVLVEEPEVAAKVDGDKDGDKEEGKEEGKDGNESGANAPKVVHERKTDPLSLRRERMKSSNRTYLTFRKVVDDEQRKPSLREVQEELRAGFDSLVVGGTLHPNLVMPTLIKQLRPSSPFVVYCQFVQPLLETMETLIKGDECADMCISETWMREYQVLPGRTHPNMHMTSASGFLLTGCKVVRNVEKPPPVPNKPKWGDEGYQGGGKKQRKE